MADESDGDIRVSNEISNSVEEYSLDRFAVKPVITKKVPHYLRASTGSCHEACKHGHPNKIKAKPMQPERRRMPTPLDREKTVEVHIYVDKKVQKKVQLDNKVEFPSAKALAPANENYSKKSLPAARKSSAHNVKSSSDKIPKVVSKVVQSNGKSSFMSAPSKRTPLYPKERNALVGPLKSSVKGVKPQSLSDTVKTSNAEVVKKYVSSKRLPLSAEAKNGRGAKPPSMDSLTRLRSKQGSEPRVGAVKTTAATSASAPSVGLKGRSQGTQGSVKKKLTTRAELKEAAAGDQNKVEEKTLHMIETKDDVLTTPNDGLLIQSPSPLSPESLNSSNEVDHDHCNLDSEYTDSEADGSVLNFTSSGDGLKGGKVGTLESDGYPMKLRFRKGTVVGDQSEADSLKRLRFKQGKTTLGDDDQGTEVVKVVLKHQETEVKKGDQVSLNNVIEETASKLVEKRKSKVKALVGAFESVISLQERKPSATNR